MRVRGWVLGLTLRLALGSVVSGQQPKSNAFSRQSTSVGVVLRGLAARAAIVFVGQVQSILPKDGVVEITFLVQQPVAGVAGGTYVMHEWAGRWTGGQQRFQVGQRAMFFLHAPSAAGLSSPVDGMAGIVPLIPMGANVDALLDVRMLAARVARPIGSTSVDAGFGAMALIDARTLVKNWRQEEHEPLKRLLPAGVLQAPEESAAAQRTDVPPLLQPREQTDVQR